MAPVNEFCRLERVYGPANINRFNLFTSINVQATVADGVSTGEALTALGIETDKKNVTVPEIKETGEFEGHVKVYKAVVATVKILVEAEAPAE